MLHEVSFIIDRDIDILHAFFIPQTFFALKVNSQNNHWGINVVLIERISLSNL